jgi:hypothetical protein
MITTWNAVFRSEDRYASLNGCFCPTLVFQRFSEFSMMPLLWVEDKHGTLRIEVAGQPRMGINLRPPDFCQNGKKASGGERTKSCFSKTIWYLSCVLKAYLRNPSSKRVGKNQNLLELWSMGLMGNDAWQKKSDRNQDSSEDLCKPSSFPAFEIQDMQGESANPYPD